MADELRVGTRGSRLATRQAQMVVDALAAPSGSPAAELVVIETLGDRLGSASFARIGEKGVFTRELESALREGRVDMAVHSLKDLPTEDARGLALAAVLEREDPREALVSRGRRRLAELPRGARVGTCSLRRRAQLLALRPELSVVELRGNVPTRVARVERGDLDAALLARAGLIRLGLEHCIAEVLGIQTMLPAPGQGAIAIQCRADDARVAGRLTALDHRPTRLATAAERAFLQALDGGCQTPIAALASWDGERLSLRGLVADADARESLRGEEAGEARDEAEARRIGARLAESLLARGAGRLVAAARSAAGAA
jgi:hydroxymethylbilane synthase